MEPAPLDNLHQHAQEHEGNVVGMEGVEEGNAGVPDVGGGGERPDLNESGCFPRVVCVRARTTRVISLLSPASR